MPDPVTSGGQEHKGINRGDPNTIIICASKEIMRQNISYLSTGKSNLCCVLQVKSDYRSFKCHFWGFCTKGQGQIS